MSFANGDEYDGCASEGCWCGEGSYTYKTGDYYSGDFKLGKKHGYGKMMFVNGDIY